MSRTTIYAAPKSGPMYEIAEYPNAWGSAAYVWSALCGAYLGDSSFWMMRSSEAEKLWALAKDPSVSECERLTLLSTFDRAMVRHDSFLKIAQAFREFHAKYPPKGVCHLLSWAALLESLASDEQVFAIGWQQTSVSENLWQVREGEDTWRPYDLARDAGHFFVGEIRQEEEE
jgi:hypothetical protein